MIRKSSRGVFYSDHQHTETQAEDMQLLKVIRSKLEKYLAANETSMEANRQRDRFENELIKQLDSHMGA